MSVDRRSERGLTLLEVLAATMIFAMVVTVLVSSSSMGAQRAQRAAIQLEADAIAESALADLEVQMRQGLAPTIEEEERTVPGSKVDFVVRVLRTEVAGQDGRGAAGLSVGGTGDLGALLARELPEVSKHLARYDVEVSWFRADGVVDQVRRTTFAFDWEAAAVEFADLFEAAGGGAPELDDAQPLDAEALEAGLPEGLR